MILSINKPNIAIIPEIIVSMGVSAKISILYTFFAKVYRHLGTCLPNISLYPTIEDFSIHR